MSDNNVFAGTHVAGLILQNLENKNNETHRMSIHLSHDAMIFEIVKRKIHTTSPHTLSIISPPRHTSAFYNLPCYFTFVHSLIPTLIPL